MFFSTPMAFWACVKVCVDDYTPHMPKLLSVTPSHNSFMCCENASQTIYKKIFKNMQKHWTKGISEAKLVYSKISHIHKFLGQTYNLQKAKITQRQLKQVRVSHNLLY